MRSWRRSGPGASDVSTSAGARRERIRFERRIALEDGYGNEEGDWTHLCGPFWAELAPMGGREEVLGQRLTGVQPYTLTILSCIEARAIDTACRAVDDRDQNRVFDIVDASNPDQRAAELSFLVKTGVAAG